MMISTGRGNDIESKSSNLKGSSVGPVEKIYFADIPTTRPISRLRMTNIPPPSPSPHYLHKSTLLLGHKHLCMTGKLSTLVFYGLLRSHEMWPEVSDDILHSEV